MLDLPIITLYDGREIPCPMCDFEQRDDICVIYRDDLWSVYVAPPIQVPHWYVLQTRRHTDGLAGLSDDEAAGLGTMQRAVAQVIADASGIDRVVEIWFGFMSAHYHTLLAPMTDYPDDLSALVESLGGELPPVARMFDDGRHKLLYSAMSPSAQPEPAKVMQLSHEARSQMANRLSSPAT
jgi:diadenosine tetraphosphate (Ap4A) HIT family hydrolase